MEGAITDLASVLAVLTTASAAAAMTMAARTSSSRGRGPQRGEPRLVAGAGAKRVRSEDDEMADARPDMAATFVDTRSVRAQRAFAEIAADPSVSSILTRVEQYIDYIDNVMGDVRVSQHHPEAQKTASVAALSNLAMILETNGVSGDIRYASPAQRDGVNREVMSMIAPFMLNETKRGTDLPHVPSAVVSEEETSRRVRSAQNTVEMWTVLLETCSIAFWLDMGI